MKLYICVLVLIICLTSCSIEQTSEGSSQAAKVEKSGNKFKDAAINKIMQANPGLPKHKAQCVVEALTKDGVYGLGEINQMKLKAVEMSENKESLNQAYYAAVGACQK